MKRSHLLSLITIPIVVFTMALPASAHDKGHHGHGRFHKDATTTTVATTPPTAKPPIIERPVHGKHPNPTPAPEHKVTICHRTGSYSNPYVRISPSVESVLHGHGHDGHNGPVFFPSIPKHTKWGDIIPPFNYGPGQSYGGKNWSHR